MNWKPTNADLIAKINEKQKARGNYDNPRIVIELSNEHGIGVESSEPEAPIRTVKSHPKLLLKTSPTKKSSAIK